MTKKSQQKLRVLVAMSGGVDSSVVAALLVHSKKYEVTGAFMVNYIDPEQGDSCYLSDYRDAMRVAAKLQIPFFKLDFSKEYETKVLSYMFSEYEKGRTPNPDVMCNAYIKFGCWLDRAKAMGFDYLATGHYARLRLVSSPRRRSSDHHLDSRIHGNKIALTTSVDENKDQTYFLHQLGQEQLKSVMFPIGGYTKDQVRKLANKFGLPTAEKEESMGICFIGEVPMKKFLLKRIKPKRGKILTSSGQIVGEHEGLSFYTNGQRLGIDHIGLEETGPVFVVDKNFASNELLVGSENDPLLYSKECLVEHVSWIVSEPKLPFKCLVRLRHRQPLQKCKVEKMGNEYKVIFEKKQRAITPGQFAVFYKNNECLGGGAVT